MISIYRKLGDLLVAQGEINQLQLSVALAAQQTSNRRLGEILVERGFTTEDKIARCLAEQYGYPFVSPEEIQPDLDALGAVDLETALNLRVLPISIDPDEFACAISDPLNLPSTEQIAAIVKRKLHLKVAPEGALIQAIRHHYGIREECTGYFVEAEHVPSRFESLLPVQRVGEVALFEAFDAMLERRVGLLVVSERSDLCQTHLRLVRTSSKAASPRVCVIHDSFAHRGYRWTVTQPLGGETLERVLRTRGRRTLQQSAATVAQVAEAVDHLHQVGAGCGWICPANVLLRPEGPMLVPFLSPPAEYVHLDSLVGGTSAMGGDLHSLGVLLWETSTGGKPSGGRPGVDFLDDSSLPMAMRQIISTCTESDPSKRFASPIQLAGVLKSYNWQATSESPESTGPEREELLSTLQSEPEGERASLWSRIFRRKSSKRAA
jgi:serine/threonine protein kinase